GEGEELKSFTTAGFLGSEFGPFNIPFPHEAARAVQPPPGMTPSRFENRDRFYRRLLEASPIGQVGSEYQREYFLRAMDNAHRLRRARQSPCQARQQVEGGRRASREAHSRCRPAWFAGPQA